MRTHTRPIHCLSQTVMTHVRLQFHTAFVSRMLLWPSSLKLTVLARSYKSGWYIARVTSIQTRDHGGVYPLAMWRKLGESGVWVRFFPVRYAAARILITATFAGSAIPVQASEVVIRLNASDAVPAASFLDSMGVNTHFTFASTPYAARYAEVRSKLAALGLHHIRDVLHPHVTDLAKLNIRTTALAEPNLGTPESFRERVKALNAAGISVDAVEGANEPDMFWERLHISWEGQGYPEGPAVWQRDLFHAFKADPATAKLTIIGPSLGLAGLPNAQPPEAWKGLRNYVDWGDFHPYPYNGNPFGLELAYGTLPSLFHNGTFPSVTMDEAPDAFRAYRTIYGSGPYAATETGYPTGPHFTSEELQAKYLPRLYAECFRLGLKRTYLYQLLDNVQDPTGQDPDASFGLLRYDLSERPSFQAIAALTRLVTKPRGPGKAVPGTLHLTLTVAGAGDFPDASRVHHLLLRRLDGTLLLLLWHEVSGEDTSSTPRRSVAVPPLPARLDADHPVRFKMEGRSIGPFTGIDVSVPDSLVALEIAR